MERELQTVISDAIRPHCNVSWNGLDEEQGNEIATSVLTAIRASGYVIGRPADLDVTERERIGTSVAPAMHFDDVVDSFEKIIERMGYALVRVQS